MEMQKQTINNLNIGPQRLEKLDPLGDGVSSLELVRVSGSDLDVVNAARVSFGKISTEISERDEKLINFLMKHKHTSPFEHNQLSFRVKCPIYISKQWMRHRMNSYNEISYRYAKAPLEFYIPPKWRGQDQVNKQASAGAFQDTHLTDAYKKTLDQAKQTYEMLLEQGVSRELARGVLPVCTYTQFIFTCNLHSLMHFMFLRLGHGAQSEIQQFAQGLLYFAEPHFPISLKAWKEFHLTEQVKSSISDWQQALGS